MPPHIPSADLQSKWGTSWHGPLMRGYSDAVGRHPMSENSEPYLWGYEHGAADIVESGRNAESQTGYARQEVNGGRGS